MAAFVRIVGLGCSDACSHRPDPSPQHRPRMHPRGKLPPRLQPSRGPLLMAGGVTRRIRRGPAPRLGR
eukprot:4799790-Pyramimonas_sp.AAC.1